jgi:hypothetical protein
VLVPGYENVDTVGTEVPDITSELLEDIVKLVHPDLHPPERRETAKRVTQELLALKPFVFPAPKPAEIDTNPKPPASKPRPDKKPSGSEKPPYPCELCADAWFVDYCDACKAERERRLKEEADRERAKHRKWYAQRKKRRLAYEARHPPKPAGPKTRTSRQSSVAVNQNSRGNLNNHRLSGLQAAILVAAYTKRVPGARGCDISNPELFVEIWGWKTTRDLRWTKERAAEMSGDYRIGDTQPSRNTHGAFNHVPSNARRSASAGLSRALTRLHKRTLIEFVSGTMGTYGGGIVLTPRGEQIAKELGAVRSS